MIKVLFTRLGNGIPETVWPALLRSLPAEAREEVNRYLRSEDRRSRLAGKALLRQCLFSYGYGNDCLEAIGSEPFGRPVIRGGVDFNISHSGEFAICAVTDRGRVGIDIEEIRPVSLGDFSACMTEEERERLESSNDRERAFYAFWTKKESTLKGDGRGLLLPMQEARIEGDEALLEDCRWFLWEIELDSGCICHLASNFRNDRVALEEADIRALL